MSESPWQPPTAGGATRPADDASESSVASEPSVPSVPSESAEPSPWSPQGAAGAGVPPAAPDHATADGAPASPPAAPPLAPPTGEHADVLDGAVVAPTPPESGPRRSKVAVGGAVVAVLAVGLAGLFAVQRFSGEATGGAATPDQLGADLLAAVEAEDVLGVIDTMSPGERDSLGDPFVEMVGELQRLEVLSAETDLSRLLGFDIELTDEQVEVRTTNVADIVTVSLTADATIAIDGASLPIGSFIEDQLPEDALDELRNTRETQTDEFDLELAAVQDGDRWYFSVFHTIAELARVDSGGGPIPAEGIVAAGGDSPEAAIDRMLDHIERLDLRGIIAMLDPAEAAALQRYAPLFLDEAEAELAEVPFEWRIDVREFRVEGDGDERTVFVDALGISGEFEGAPFSVRFSDGCVRAEFDGETTEQCTSSADDELGSIFADAPAIEAFGASLEEAFSDVEPIGLELRRRDGAWYVSPFATVTDAVLAMLRALDRNELDRLVEDGTAAADEFFGMFLGGFGLGGDVGFDDEFGIEEEFGDEDDFGFEDEPGFPDDPLADDGAAATAWDECYSESVAADAAACFEGYVATGEIDRASVPVALLYPECGLAELSWEGGLYSATDEEFAAALDVAVPCFQELVERGELEEWAVPFEVQYAECFEGRNWYNEFDDDEYNARVDACMAD